MPLPRGEASQHEIGGACHGSSAITDVSPLVGKFWADPDEISDRDASDVLADQKLQLGVLVDRASQAARGRAFAPGGRGLRFPVGLAVLSSTAPPGRPKALSSKFISRSAAAEDSGELSDFWRAHDSMAVFAENPNSQNDLNSKSLVIKKELVARSMVTSRCDGTDAQMENATCSNSVHVGSRLLCDFFPVLQPQDPGNLAHVFSQLTPGHILSADRGSLLSVEDFPPLHQSTDKIKSMIPIWPSDLAVRIHPIECGLESPSAGVMENLMQVRSVVNSSIIVGANVCPLSPRCLKPLHQIPMCLSGETLQSFYDGPPSPLGPWEVSCAWDGPRWQTPTGWFWVPKGSTDFSLGFPAKASEIQRFGHSARLIKLLPPPAPLLKSFAQAVGGVEMNRGNDQFRGKSGFRDDSRK
ncbi:hypothetical protein ACQ4PT_011088 [Festuca glaucescens]